MNSDSLPFKGCSLAELENSAISAAMAAGDILRDGFYSDLKVRQKSSTHDLVTEFDEKAELFIKTSLLDTFPSHAFVGEESGIFGDIENDVTWVVDPIDGTWNFSRQIPSFAVSIAAVFRGTPYVAVCYDPLASELFVAKRGHGALMNGKKIHVSQTNTLEESGISLGTTVGIDAIHKISLIRRSGSSVLDLCYVAKGALEGFIEWRLNSWDYAAAMLIIQESGGRISDELGNPIHIDYADKKSIVASNSHIHEELLKWTSKVKK